MNRSRDAWFRQPVVWLGALILAASLTGCAVMITLAWRAMPYLQVTARRNASNRGARRSWWPLCARRRA